MNHGSWKTLPAVEVRQSGRLDLLNLTRLFCLGYIKYTRTSLVPLLEDIRDISLGVNNSIHVPLTALSSLSMFYNSQFAPLSLLPQSILGHGRFTTTLQTPSACSKWDKATRLQGGCCTIRV